MSVTYGWCRVTEWSGVDEESIDMELFKKAVHWSIDDLEKVIGRAGVTSYCDRDWHGFDGTLMCPKHGDAYYHPGIQEVLKNLETLGFDAINENPAYEEGWLIINGLNYLASGMYDAQTEIILPAFDSEFDQCDVIVKGTLYFGVELSLKTFIREALRVSRGHVVDVDLTEWNTT